MGLGDWMVVVALAIMGFLLARPWLRGHKAAGGEAEARQQLEAWRNQADASGLLTALDKLHGRAKAIEGLRAFDSFLGGGVSNVFLPCWTDDDYFYRIEFEGKRQLAAYPSRPGFSGINALGLDDERIVSHTIKQGSRSAQIERAEAAARQRLRALGKAARDAGLGAALADFVRRSTAAWSSPEIKASSDKGLPQPPYDAAPGRLVVRLGNAFYGSCAIVHDDEGKLGLEFYAWPDRAKVDGFAALRWTAVWGTQFSRNLVERYQGLTAVPLPGAGARRPGAEIQHRGYTGLDGNRWIAFAKP